MEKHVKSIISIAVIYLLIIIAFGFFHYKNVRNGLIADIDQKLTSAIHSTRVILGHDFHDNVLNKESVSEEEDFELAIQLYQYAQDINIEYVYSLKRFDGEILFVTSSATEQEIEFNDYQPAYYTQYPDMDQAIERSFTTQTIQSAEYSDRWGSFRSIFIPFKTTSGDTYVIGADVSIDEVKNAVLKSVSLAIGMVLFMGLLIIPMLILLYKSIQREWQSKYQALFVDELTGLPNSNQLMKDLEASKETHLALVEINKFSDVISSYGPSIGDHILKQFAYRLNNFCHPLLKNYQAYRLGGSVFAIFENQSLAAEQVSQGTVELINDLITSRYRISSTEYINLVVTIGGVNQSEDAYMLANMALEEAKRKNIQSFVYDSESTYLPKMYKENHDIKLQLEAALAEGRLVPYFQPIMDSKERKIIKYECLARIVDEHGEVMITPDLFLPVARSCRLYPEVTQRMVMKSIKAIKNTHYIISINLSISDIMNGSTRYLILKAVKDSSIAAQIQFEILETEAINDLNKVLDFILKLQRLGAKVGLDDLGRSYSNFDRLTHLPVDFIKIDGSIITSIENDAEAQKAAKNIVELAHRHDIKVTAEYCYNEATTEMAANLGVDYLQGFYLGKPEHSIQQPVQLEQFKTSASSLTTSN